MGRVTLTLPRLGETMEEARVTLWHVQPGAAFRRGEVLLEVETDKTVVEVSALAAGVLLAQLVVPGQTVALDQPIAEVEGEMSAPVRPVAVAEASGGDISGQAIAQRVAGTPAVAEGGRVAASPAARAAARRAGVELRVVPGTGRRGRITGADVAALAPRGRQVVLLHGLFDDSHGWRDLPRHLAAAGLRVLALDLPGHGDAPPAPGFDAAVAQLAAALPPGPLVLIGHSLGAALAVRLALHPGVAVERLVLLAPLGIGARIEAGFAAGMLAADTVADLSAALALTDAGPLSPAALERELARLHRLRPGHALLAAAVAGEDGRQAIDATGDLARLDCPVAVVFGTADRILDWRDVANLPADAAIHLLRGAGHLPHAAAPALVARLAGGSATHEERRIGA